MSNDGSSTLKNLTDTKLVSFALGQPKKSRFQKEREEKELKKKQDEKEAAKVFESFVESFQDHDDGPIKTFVRSGESRSKKSREMDSFMNELEMKAPKITPLPLSKKVRQMDELFDEIKAKHETGPDINKVEPLRNSEQYREKGSFDDGDPTTTNLYVGNLHPLTTEERLFEVFGRYGDINSVKIMWPRSEEERARGRNTGFVSFKKRKDAEKALSELKDCVLDGHGILVGWGKAVKILSSAFVLLSASAPHSSTADDVYTHRGEPARSRASSFAEPRNSSPGPQPDDSDIVSPAALAAAIAAATAAAAKAAAALLKKDSAIVAATPRAVAGGDISAESSMQPPLSTPPTPVPASFAPPTPSQPVSIPCPPPPPSFNRTTVGSSSGPSAEPTTAPPSSSSSSTSYVRIVLPADRYLRELIDTVATFVARDGEALEKELKTTEANNPEYDFLFAPESTLTIDKELQQLREQRHQYYRWRVVSLLCGDNLRRWREEPFQVLAQGPYWVPPSMENWRDEDSDEDRGYSHFKRRREDEYAAEDNHQRRRPFRAHHSESSSEDDSDTDSRASRSSSSSFERRQQRHRRRGDRGSGDRASHRRSDRRGGRSRREEESAADKARFAGLTGAQIQRLRDAESTQRRLKLSRRKHTLLLDLLRHLSLSRRSIAHTMAFCFDHVEHSADIVRTIVDSLQLNDAANNIHKDSPALSSATSPDLAPAVKIAGLCLLSDLLHNSATPIKHASHYRTLIEAELPGIIEALGHLLHRPASTLGRMTAFQTEDRIQRHFHVWSDWSIFPASYMTGLQTLFALSESDCQQIREYIAMEIRHIEQCISERRAIMDADHAAAQSDVQNSAADHHHAEVTSTVLDELWPTERRERLIKQARSFGVATSYTHQSLLPKEGVSIGAIPVDLLGLIAASCKLAFVQQGIASTAAATLASGVALSSESVVAATVEVDSAAIRNAAAAVAAAWASVTTGAAVVQGNVDEDIDGAPIEADEDIDGVPMAMPLSSSAVEEEDIDGAPMEACVEEDIDGAPMEACDDIDGVPM